MASFQTADQFFFLDLVLFTLVCIQVDCTEAELRYCYWNAFSALMLLSILCTNFYVPKTMHLRGGKTMRNMNFALKMLLLSSNLLDFST